MSGKARLARALSLDWSNSSIPAGTEVQVLEEDAKDGTVLVKYQEETFWVPNDALEA